MKILLHFCGAESQLGDVIAGGYKPLRLLTAVFYPHIFGGPQIPVQTSEAWRARRLQIRHGLPIRCGNSDFDFVPSKFAHPNCKQSAFGWVLTAINAFAV